MIILRASFYVGCFDSLGKISCFSFLSYSLHSVFCPSYMNLHEKMEKKYIYSNVMEQSMRLKKLVIQFMEVETEPGEIED